MRTTRDIDFAVLVGSQKEYEAVKQYLVDYNGFIESKQSLFCLRTPGGIAVDILPFGEIEGDNSIILTRTGLSNIKVAGFMEVYKEGTHQVNLSSGHQFKIASLEGIVL